MSSTLRIIVAILLLSSATLFGSTTLLAQADRTGAGRSYAQIDQSTGQIIFTNSPLADAQPGGVGRFAVRINDEYYVNATRQPLDGSLLQAPAFTRTNDSLITSWFVGGCMFTQIVYPYQTGEEFKLATRYFATALAGKVTIQAQAILGVYGSPLNYQKAKPYPMQNYFDTVPSHIAFMGKPYETEIYWRFPRHEVIKPSEMLFGGIEPLSWELNWNNKKEKPQNSSHGFAVNMLWDSLTLLAGETKEIGSYLFGAAEYVKCEDSITSTLFYPKHVLTPAEDASSRTLPLYAYFSRSELDAGWKAPSATIKATRGLTITSLSLVEHPDSTLRVVMQKDEQIKGWSTAFTVDLLAEATDKQQITRNLEVGIDQQGWPAHVSGCTYSIDLLQRTGKDLIAAAIIDQTRDLYAGDCKTQRDTIVISDIATPSEKGIKSIEYFADNYDVRYLTEPVPFSPSQRLLISVIDSFVDGSVTFNVLDGEEHVSKRQIDYCTTPDTLRPEASLSTNADEDWIVSISDDRPWDRKLASVRLLTAHDVEVRDRVFAPDSTRAIYRIHPISNASSFSLIAEDRVGNLSDTIVASKASSSVLVEEGLQMRVETRGNMLNIHNATDSHVRLIDVLGRIVLDQEIAIPDAQISISALASGRYYLIIGKELLPLDIKR